MSELIECSMCGKMISPNATTCPNCGEPKSTSNLGEKSNEEILYQVELVESGKKKLMLNMGIQAITGLNYKKVKLLIESAPVLIPYNDKYDSNMIQKRFEKMGAVVNLIPLKNNGITNYQKDNDKIRCPKCNSSQITNTSSRGFSKGKAVAGGVLLGPLGVAVGVTGPKKIKVVCMACGHSWDPSQRK